MFAFLERWDPILADYKCDIDGVIKGELKLWTVAIQTYCERLMILFNNKEKIYPTNERITLGHYLNDSYFVDIFEEKTGFHDFGSLRRLNEFSNKRKHSGVIDDSTKNEIKAWVKRLHTLSIKTYSYLEGETVIEEFNEIEVDKLLTTSEEDFLTTIDYADQIISRKNDIINQLEENYQDLISLVSDDTIDIIEKEQQVKKLEEENSRYKDHFKKYRKEKEIFVKYIEQNKEKSLLHEEIKNLIINSPELQNREQILSTYTKIEILEEEYIDSIKDVNLDSFMRRKGDKAQDNDIYVMPIHNGNPDYPDEDYQGAYSLLVAKVYGENNEVDYEIDRGYLEDDDFSEY